MCHNVNQQQINHSVQPVALVTSSTILGNESCEPKYLIEGAKCVEHHNFRWFRDLAMRSFNSSLISKFGRDDAGLALSPFIILTTVPLFTWHDCNNICVMATHCFIVFIHTSNNLLLSSTVLLGDTTLSVTIGRGLGHRVFVRAMRCNKRLMDHAMFNEP